MVEEIVMALTVEEGLALIYTHVTPKFSEILPIENTLGRILAEDVFSVYSLPPYDNSAMDGYAVFVSDAGKNVKQSCVIFAGDASEVRMVEDQCIRIMTGAKIPSGCEAIVPIEEVSILGDWVTLPESIRPSQHIRLKGEDIQAGISLLSSGTQLYAHHITLLASQGITHVKVFRKPKVALFA